MLWCFTMRKAISLLLCRRSKTLQRLSSRVREESSYCVRCAIRVEDQSSAGLFKSPLSQAEANRFQLVRHSTRALAYQEWRRVTSISVEDAGSLKMLFGSSVELCN